MTVSDALAEGLERAQMQRTVGPADLKQTMYPNVSVSIASQPDGGRMLIIDTPTDGRLVFPMSADAAQEIGRTLTAPSVVRANGMPATEAPPNRAQRRSAR